MAKPPRRKSTAARFPATDELARLLVEEVRDYAIFVIDLDNKIRMWNPGAEAILGFRRRQILGKSAAIIFTPEDRAAGEVEKEMRASTRRGRVEEERWHIRRGGKRFWGSGIMTALRDEHGKLVGHVKVMRDFTSRKREQDIRAATTE